MSPTQDQVLFVTEAGELLESLEQGLMGLSGTTDPDAVNALFRAAHTIKGNSGIVGAAHCAAFTHTLENVLARVRDGALVPDETVVDLLLQSVDVLRELVSAIGAGDQDPAPRQNAALFEALAELSHSEATSPTAASATQTFRIVLSIPETEAPALLRGLVEEIAALGQLRSIEPPLETPDAREFRFDLEASLRKADIEGMVIFSNAAIEIYSLGIAARAPAEAAPDKPAATTATSPARRSSIVKIDSSRLDQMLDRVGELTIAISALRNRASDPSVPRSALLESIEGVDRLGADLHDGVMALRMVPVRDTFERMRRPVRDAAAQLDKLVTFETEGLETELDRKLLDELADPLTHMVRNAVAHGIEAPAMRTKAGKPATGRLVLRAMHRNGSAVIEVADDGGGIDPAKVLARAIERGLIAPGAVLSREDTYALLFAPGFSTAEAVNQVAGRGVGLDVVVKSVERLRGRVEIDSVLGSGTVFRIRLPLTLAIMDGVRVKVGAETVAIPLRDVEELLDPNSAAIQTLEGQSEYVDLRGQLLPVVRLDRALGMRKQASDLQGKSIVVVKSDRRRFAIAADSVLGIARTVVKSLDGSFELFGRTSDHRRPQGVGGATILDDGSVGLVLDVHGLDTRVFEQS